MRALLIVLACASTARADVRATGAVGAGGQGDAVYSGVDLGVDGEWGPLRFGVGGRLVLLDGGLRDGDWERAADALRLVRWLELAGAPGGVRLALAAGGLAPAQLGHVADGYRATLDDRPRTGVRAAVATERVAVRAELDDVVAPEFAGGAASWQHGAWVGSAATAVDVTAGEAAIELAGARRWQDADDASGRTGHLVDLGAGVVGEPGLGLAAVAFGELALDRAGARWTARAELRAGTGTVGAAFGPLHRIERAELYARSRAGVGGAVTAAVTARAGWVAIGVRARPELPALATLAAGAPMGRRFQLAGWVAATRREAAGAGALRIPWSRRLATALEVARIVEPDAMQPAWSATAWLAATVE